MAAPYYFQIPTQIIYGRDSVHQLGDVLHKLNIHKVQVITDPALPVRVCWTR